LTVRNADDDAQAAVDAPDPEVTEPEPALEAENTEVPDVEAETGSAEPAEVAVDTDGQEEAPVEEEPIAPEEESPEPSPLAGVGAPQELFYDPVFAWRAGLALGIVFVLLVWPLWILAARIIIGGSALERFPASVALTLVLVGVALAVGGLYLALLEFRARARVVAAAASAETVRARGMASDVVTAAPDILKAFGQLTTVAALLVVATVLCICGTVLAWHGLT
jgi:hypothetical protein